MKTKLDRRLFLRGLGGAAIAAPFLSTLNVRNAIGQTPAVAKRVIIYFTHYGCITDKWFPATSHGALTAAELEATSLKSLAPHVSKLLMPRGIRGMNEWTFGREFGQETDPHSQVMASYLTSAPVDRTSSGQTVGGGMLNFDKLNAKAYGRSMDHFIADQLNAPGVGPLVAHFGGVKTGAIDNLSYSAALEMYTGVGNASQMYASLTNLNAGGGSPEAPEATYEVAARGKSAVDLVRDDLMRLKTQRMSAADYAKIDHWAELLTQATNVVRSDLCTDAKAAELGISAPAGGGGGGGGGGSGFQNTVKPMMDLAVMNALCNQNAIMMLMMPGTANMSFVTDSSTDSHGLSHRIGDAGMGGPCVTGVLGMLEKIDIWYAEQFAYLVGQLDSITETEGATVLDNSATIWLMEQSDGQAHNLNNMPILQAGSLGGYFKTGVAVNVDGGADKDPGRGNSLSQCGDGDTSIGNNEVQNTGTDNALANKPMTKYLYNLMNGLGVKANADGFPDPAGSAKVSKFGWTDDQKQFAEFVPNSGQGIADKPQGTFIDPGEFTELLA